MLDFCSACQKHTPTPPKKSDTLLSKKFSQKHTPPPQKWSPPCRKSTQIRRFIIYKKQQFLTLINDYPLLSNFLLVDHSTKIATMFSFLHITSPFCFIFALLWIGLFFTFMWYEHYFPNHSNKIGSHSFLFKMFQSGLPTLTTQLTFFRSCSPWNLVWICSTWGSPS